MITCFLAFCLAATLMHACTLGQGSCVWEWDETYGGADDERAYSIIETIDGGYAIIGSTNSFTTGHQNMWLVKADSAGKSQWSQSYGGTNQDVGVSLVQTSSGGYILGGWTDSFGAGGYDFWLVKTDSSGNVLWNQTYGGENNDRAESVVQTGDGGYAMVGRTSSFGVGIDDFWLVKTDSSGNVLWNQTYGGAGIDWAQSVVQTGDGGYAMVGRTSSFGVGIDDFWLVKTDSSGNVLWNQTYGGAGIDWAQSVVQTGDGGYALGGWTDSFGAGGYDFWLVKMRQRVQRDLAVALDAPTTVFLDGSSLLEATVTNWGLSNESDVELFLLVDGTIVDSATIPELLTGSSYTLSYLWAPTVEGSYNVTAYAPPVSGENITTNNIVTKIVDVTKPTVVYVDPETTTAWLGDTFVVDIKIAEVKDLGGYEFKLLWNTTLLDCTSSTINRMWFPNDFIAKDEVLDNYNVTHGRYWCGYASISASSFSGNATLASLTFEVAGGSMDGSNCTLDLYDIFLVNPEAEIIGDWYYKDSPNDGYVTCMLTNVTGDINNDGIVDIVDIVIVALAFGSTPEDPHWNPIADLNQDNIIDIVDIVLVAIHFGETL
jgi:hypothetical protein